MTSVRAMFALLLTGALLFPDVGRGGMDTCGPGMATATAPVTTCSQHHPGGAPVHHDRQHCAGSPTCANCPALAAKEPVLVGSVSHSAPVVLAIVIAESRSSRPDAPPPRYIGL